MAMGPDRVELLTDISYFVNETGTRGRVMVYDTTSTGLGAAMDSSDAVVMLPDVANGSGELVAGILVNDVVNKDLSQTHLNRHKDEVQVGSKVRLLKRGWITTDVIDTGYTVTPGAPAYFTTDGVLNGTSTNSTRVGTWGGGEDSDGFAKLHVDIV